MARRYEDEEEEIHEELMEGEEGNDDGGHGKRKRRLRRSRFVDDDAEEDDEVEEKRRRKKKMKKGRRVMDFIDDTAVDASDEEEEPEEEEGFIIADDVADIPEDDGDRKMRHGFDLHREEEQSVEDIERLIQERYGRAAYSEYDEETTNINVEQQALLPSNKDPKLWMVKCAIGRQREAAFCLMQKYLDSQSQGIDLKIRSVISVDHLKDYIYVEAEKEAHVKEAIKGLRNIYACTKRTTIVPIKEMTDVLSVESKSAGLSKDTWVRVKIGKYKGDLAKVVDVDDFSQKVTIRLLPRIDLQALANKMEGKVVPKNAAFNPPPRRICMREVSNLHIPVVRKRNRQTHQEIFTIDNMIFQDGFLLKTVAIKSITSQIREPTFDELEKFGTLGEDANRDVSSLSNIYTNRKKGHFMRGDAVVVVRGDLRNLRGKVEKVEEETVHIKTNIKGLQETVCINEKDLCKYFNLGDHVKVVGGAHEGVTGMVVKVEGHNVIIISDTTKEDVKVFAENVAKNSEVTSGVTKLGEYELHDLILLVDRTFGVIIRVESEAFHILKGYADKAEVAVVKLREIKDKIVRKMNAQDKFRNLVSSKDVVRICDGPCYGKQGQVEHIYNGLLFIHYSHRLENAGYICVKAQSCFLVGGSRGSNGRDELNRRYDNLWTSHATNDGRPQRGALRDYGGRGCGGRVDPVVGKTIRKNHSGPFKGYHGRIRDVAYSY